MEIISKIDKHAGEIKKLLDGLDPKTEVEYYCEFGNEELETIFLAQLEDVSLINDDGEEKYLLGNVDNVVEEFFKKEEVIKERLQFYDPEAEDIEEDDDEDDEEEDDDEEVLDEESDDDVLDGEDEDDEIGDDEEEVNIEDEICKLEDENSEIDEEIKNHIKFYITLKGDRYINIFYIPQFDDKFNLTGVKREISLEISAD